MVGTVLVLVAAVVSVAGVLFLNEGRGLLLLLTALSLITLLQAVQVALAALAIMVLLPSA